MFVSGWVRKSRPPFVVLGFLSRFMFYGKKTYILVFGFFFHSRFCYNDDAAAILHKQVLNKCAFTKLLGNSVALQWMCVGILFNAQWSLLYEEQEKPESKSFIVLCLWS